MSELSKLRPRQRHVLILLAAGGNDHTISNDLGIAEKTVQFHRLNLHRKLKFKSVVDLVKFAVRHNLVEP